MVLIDDILMANNKKTDSLGISPLLYYGKAKCIGVFKG